MGRFLNADDTSYLNADGTPLSCNLFAYCKNNPIASFDPTGHFLLSTAVLIGAVVGGIIGATLGGVAAYSAAQNSGAEGWELAGWTALGILGGGTVGAAVGAAAGYGIGYIAGGTYANGLGVKAVNTAVKSFFSQPNKVHKLLTVQHHFLSGYTAEAAAQLMTNTLANGVVGAYKAIQSVYWAAMNSEVVFTFVDGLLTISNMWVKSGGK